MNAQVWLLSFEDQNLLLYIDFYQSEQVHSQAFCSWCKSSGQVTQSASGRGFFPLQGYDIFA